MNSITYVSSIYIDPLGRIFSRYLGKCYDKYPYRRRYPLTVHAEIEFQTFSNHDRLNLFVPKRPSLDPNNRRELLYGVPFEQNELVFLASQHDIEDL